MGPEILFENGGIQWLARRLRSRVRVRVNQAGQQPTLSHQLSATDRIRRPPVPVRIEINRLAIGQSDPTHPQNRHQTTPAVPIEHRHYDGPRVTLSVRSFRRLMPSGRRPDPLRAIG